VKRRLPATLAIASAVLLLASCAKIVEGNPVSSGTDPYEVAGKPVTDAPSGLRPNAQGPLRPVLNGDGGEMDHLALMAVADIEEFWKGAYGPPLKDKFKPVKALF
jgi:hypothetical protein